MLALIAGNHVDRLLQQIEVEVLVASGGTHAVVAIDVGMGTCIKEGVDLRLGPTRLLQGLELCVEVA